MARPSLDDTTPVIVGVGQVTAEFPSDEPTDLLAEAIERAAPGRRALSVDSLQVVAMGTRRYSDPGALVAARLGLSSIHTVYTAHGGQTPQALITRAACDVHEGRFRCVAIGGAESWRTRTRLKRSGTPHHWSNQDPAARPDESFGEQLRMASDLEEEVGFGDPLDAYPLMETALRHASGRSLGEHAAHVARLWAEFSVVASSNPYAALGTNFSAEDIGTPSHSNRWISHPYTKLEVANNNVDQAAAVIVTTAAHARALGVPRDEWVFLHGSGESVDCTSVTARASLSSSAAIATAGRSALEEAGIGIDDIAYLDLYSCFPSAVQIAADELRIGPGRPLTVTGGLTFAGGPWNNYVTHAVASMVERLRAEPEELGLCTANGGLLTKHAVGIYGATPPTTPLKRPVVERGFATQVVVASHDAESRIVGYTVRYGRDGSPTHGFAVCESAESTRLLSRTEDVDLLEWMASHEAVGARAVTRGRQLVAVEPAPGR